MGHDALVAARYSRLMMQRFTRFTRFTRFARVTHVTRYFP
jgi:hypothetical protein